MPAEANAPTAPAGGPAMAAEQSTTRKVLGVVGQMAFFWVLSQAAKTYFAKPDATTPSPPAVTNTNVNGGPQDIPKVDPRLLPPTHVTPAWMQGQSLSMQVHLVTPHPEESALLPHFRWDNITLGDYADTRVIEYDITFPPSVLNNGSLYADIFLVKDGSVLDPRDPKFNPANIHHVRKSLTPYIARPKVRKEKNLLSATDTEEEEEPLQEADVIMPYWHSNVTLTIMSDPAPLAYSTLPPPIREHVHVVKGVRDETGAKGLYMPIVFPNEFWQLRSHYVEINSTTTTLPLQITFQPLSLWKFQMFASMTHGFEEAQKQQGGASSAEMDEIKRMLLETNPWFLGLTGLVSVLHMVFEMLAFKSDVSHWREKKEMIGVSVRTIVTNVFVQVVVLLYLLDNNENTSWMILFGSGMGVLVEAWKITKAVDIKLIPSQPGSLIPYKLDIQDKHVLSEDEKKTQEYDKIAFRYVSWVTIPLLAGYTVYSLMYESHKGWYSFVISTLTSFVYMFGFAQLVPQLIINYKLKSVAHMPMKAMIFKSLSTVVDDLFAFCIKMPFLHRLACFRDDVVFAVFLYQRWIYRIDPKRVNEYGQVLDEEGAKEIEEKEKAKALEVKSSGTPQKKAKASVESKKTK